MHFMIPTVHNLLDYLQYLERSNNSKMGLSKGRTYLFNCQLVDGLKERSNFHDFMTPYFLLKPRIERKTAQSARMLLSSMGA